MVFWLTKGKGRVSCLAKVLPDAFGQQHLSFLLLELSDIG